MITQTLLDQASSGRLAPQRILVPANFSFTSDNAGRKERVMETPIEGMAARLARHPFFAAMNRRQLALLGGCAMTVQFKKGEVIFHEGDPADRFYLIETGKVLLESNSGLRDPRVGWSWMFPPHTRTYTARAVEPITAIFFYGAILREYCEKDHSFGYELLKRMSFAMYQRSQVAQNEVPTIHHYSDTLPAGEAVAA
jgi:CRP/FNR family cyclic AMP-dependent transcriptional regulator